jgi:hypothetical protein
VNVLVYVRRSKLFDDSVLNFAQKNIQADTIKTVSEYFNGDYRIDINSTCWDNCSKTQSFIDENLDLSKLIFRDRVLRNTSHVKCLLLIRRATGEILHMMKSNTYDALVIYHVDNYIMDILVQIAEHLKIKTYGVCNFFMKGYKRITSYGEHNSFREPSENEVDSAIEILTNNFRSHMAPSRKTAIKAAFIRYLKYKIRYPLFYILGAVLLKRNEYDLLATPYITTVRSISNFFVERFFTSLDKVDFTKKSILVPLHYFPEATIEYWSGDLRQVEFEEMLRCKVDELSARYEQIILKEHPATVFDNSSNFYRSLLKNPKVILVDPFVSTSSILKSVDVVGAWTGTIGVEALVNYKKVELFSEKNYYRTAMDMNGKHVHRENLIYSVSNSNLLMLEILKGCIKEVDV